MNDKYEDICWYHGKISREEAEEILKNGNYALKCGNKILSTLF